MMLTEKRRLLRLGKQEDVAKTATQWMKGFFSKVLSHEKICWAGYHNTIVLGDCFPPSLPFVTKQEANRKLLYSNRDC